MIRARVLSSENFIQWVPQKQPESDIEVLTGSECQFNGVGKSFYVQAFIDGKPTTVRLPASVMDIINPPPPPPPPPATNGVWTVGDRVKPIGWRNAETGEPSESVATMVEVSEGGVKVEFGPDVTRDGTTVPFHFVNECIEAA